VKRTLTYILSAFLFVWVIGFLSYHTALHHTALHHTALHHTALYHTALHTKMQWCPVSGEKSEYLPIHTHPYGE
jgi:hypothetical protein